MRHLIFIFVDHFEPREPEHMTAWLKRYPQVASRFVDADGRHPQHTWFYDGADPEVLSQLSSMCQRGLGEIELHLHHSHDTSGGLRRKLERRKRIFAEHGALITAGPNPKHTFGFIHGKWSLDNSRGDKFCGVNSELTVLRDAGCYADFTFPAWGRMQPSKFNSIFYATDDPDRPKSYDTGVDVEASKAPLGDLMIFQGPGKLSGIPAKLSCVPGTAKLVDRLWLTCAMDAHLPVRPQRVDRWVEANVHVKGRDDWVFVKVHTHGARPRNYTAYFDKSADVLHGYLNERYNDGHAWKLHYATAREAYNMVKAAEAAVAGDDPNVYRDFLLAPYRNRSQHVA